MRKEKVLLGDVKPKVIKNLEFRTYPNKEQIELLKHTFGCTRFVWNHVLAMCIKDYEAWKTNPNLPKPSININTINKYLNILKAEYPFLQDVSAVALQQVCRNLVTAFSSFFRNPKKVGYPKFKKKFNRESFRLTDNAFRFLLNKETGKEELFIAKSKTPLKVKWSRDIPVNATSVTIKQTPSGKYFAVFTTEVEAKVTNGTKEVGIDMGLTDFITTSDKEVINHKRSYFSLFKQLKRAQRKLSKTKKGSSNRNKARLIVAKIHEKIANIRKDFLHKVTRMLVDSHRLIGLEMLNVNGMLKNRRLSKSISDASWSTFKDLLVAKSLESEHCQLVFMDRFYPSSKLCSHCDTKNTKLKLHHRAWECESCNTLHDRDHNAAINILTKAQEVYRDLLQGHWTNKIIVAKLATN